jgi:hypothetical protein
VINTGVLSLPKNLAAFKAAAILRRWWRTEGWPASNAKANGMNNLRISPLFSGFCGGTKSQVYEKKGLTGF